MIRRKVTTKKDVVSEKQIQILKIPYNQFEKSVIHTEGIFQLNQSLL